MKELIDAMLEAKREFLSKCEAVEKEGISLCGLPHSTHISLEGSEANLWALARKLGTNAVDGEPNGELQRFEFKYAGELFFWLA